MQLDWSLSGIHLYSVAVGDSTAARLGPERSILSTYAAHFAVDDGYGQQRQVAGRLGPRLRPHSDSTAISS